MNTEFEKELQNRAELYAMSKSGIEALRVAHNQHLRTVLERLKANPILQSNGIGGINQGGTLAKILDDEIAKLGVK